MAYMKKDYIDVKYYDIADGMYKSWGWMGWSKKLGIEDALHC
jgi:hypothetical protein